MALDLKKLQAKSAHISLEYDATPFSFDYRPELFDSNMQRRIEAMQDRPTVDPLVEMLVVLIKAWDIEDGGEPLPVDADNLARLPVRLLGAMTQAIAQDVSGTGASGNGAAPSVAG